MTHALFVNSGILGLKTFAHFVEHEFMKPGAPVRATQVVLTERLTPRERIVRWLLCTPLVPQHPATANLDLLRYRAEWNAGLLSRWRIGELERAGERFDVIHFHRQATAYASIERMRRTPSIVSIDCTQRCIADLAGGGFQRLSYRPSLRRDGDVFRAAKLIVATSSWAAASVRREYPDCDTEIVVMPNPVALDAFDPAWVDERRARAAREASYRPRVLFVGGDFRRKGGYELLAVWRELRFGDRAHLDLVTSAPIDAPILSPGVTVHTDVAAHTEEWRRLWRSADVFAMPTRDEAFGVVFQEAAAAGLPAIGTNINAIPELIADRESGLIIGRDDRDALAGTLEQLIASPDERYRMGRRARRLVEESADSMLYRDRLSALIERVARCR